MIAKQHCSFWGSSDFFFEQLLFGIAVHRCSLYSSQEEKKLVGRECYASEKKPTMHSVHHHSRGYNWYETHMIQTTGLFQNPFKIGAAAFGKRARFELQNKLRSSRERRLSPYVCSFTITTLFQLPSLVLRHGGATVLGFLSHVRLRGVVNGCVTLMAAYNIISKAAACFLPLSPA